MIQLDFSSDFLEKDIKKLSVITDADSFVYGLFDSRNILVARGRTESGKLSELTAKWAMQGCEIHYMSTSRAFSFAPESDVKMAEKPGILVDKWIDNQAVCLYEDYSNFDRSWEYKHVSTAWVHFHPTGHHTPVWVHFKENSILLAGGKSSAFRLFNEFDIANAEDVIYYVHACVKEVLKEDINNVSLHVSGQITLNSAFYQLMYRYIPHIQTISVPEFATASEVLGDHVYFDHYLNIHCHAHH